ncbi:three-helix bundle dimerization domain-containing protein [Flindersiella endophytica]
MPSEHTQIHPPNDAIDHLISTLTERFEEDYETVAEIVRGAYRGISETARFDTHLIPLTQHQATDELRARQRSSPNR